MRALAMMIILPALALAGKVSGQEEPTPGLPTRAENARRLREDLDAATELSAEGRQKLVRIVARGFALAREREIQSVSDPSRLVADRFTMPQVLAIVLSEQTGTGEYATEDGAVPPMARVFSVFARNGNGSYRHAWSTADAGGAAQFLRPTWEGLRRNRPEAELPPFHACLADVSCQVVAILLYFDATLSPGFTTAERRRLADGSLEQMFFLAAAYNCGPECALRAFRANFQGNWLGCHDLPDETAGYLAKISHLYGLLTALAMPAGRQGGTP